MKTKTNIKKAGKFLFIALMPFSNALYSRDFNIIDFGAVSDTTVLSTRAIQKAIDSSHDQGGGRVFIPNGDYKTGSIVLKSNVILFLEPGATLYGSRNLADYKRIKPEYISLRTQDSTIQLIYAENADHVGIIGHGIIDGQGRSFKRTLDDEGLTRPHLLCFIACTNIIIENVTLKNAGCWMQHYLACEGMKIDGVKVLNRVNYNNDGLDIDGCRDVTVSNFISDSDDDGITLKSTSQKPCENITINNCIVSSRCNAIKLGTESNGGFKNIIISNCVVKPSAIEAPAFYGDSIGVSGISLEIVDGGTMEGILVSDIIIEGTLSPIFVRLGNRARPFHKNIPVTRVGSIEDVTINNILVKNARAYGSSVTGIPGHPVKNIRFYNITVEQEGGIDNQDIYRKIEEKEDAYPSVNMFGILPAFGFYIRHVEDITFEGIKLSTKEKDQRPAFFLEDVEGGWLNNMQIAAHDSVLAAIMINASTDITITNNILNGTPESFVWIEGNLPGITIKNNLIKNVMPVINSEKRK